MNEQHKYALLSKASYDYYYTGLDQTQKELSKYQQTKDYAVNTDLTNLNHTVLVSPKEVVISYRGTDPRNVSDLVADSQIVLGMDKLPLHSLDRFTSANSLYLKTKNIYPDRKITLTGHSLGSALSVYVGMKNGVESFSFNEGTSPFSSLFSQIIGSKESAKKQHIYLTGKDLISNFAGLQPYQLNYIKTEKKGYFQHALSYFLPKTTDSTIPDYLQPKQQHYIVNKFNIHQVKVKKKRFNYLVDSVDYNY